MTTARAHVIVPDPQLVRWPLSAADLVYLRHVLAQNPRLTYGIEIHDDDAAHVHAHIVFFLRSA